MTEPRSNTAPVYALLPKPLLRSMFSASLESDTMRWAGELLLLGSACFWALHTLAMLTAQLGQPLLLPIVESAVGTILFFALWRYYPRQLHPATPILLQAAVVFTLIAFAVSYENATPLSAIWIVAWACCAASILTLGLGLINALALVVAGTLALNLIIDWVNPTAVIPIIASVIGVFAAAVVACITHCVCFQLTRFSATSRQLERVRSEMLSAFAHELTVPRAAVGRVAFRNDVNARNSAELGLISSQLYVLAQIMRSKLTSSGANTEAQDMTTLNDLVTTATSMVRRVCIHNNISVDMQSSGAESRLIQIPARTAVMALAFLARDAALRPGTQAIRISTAVRDNDGESLAVTIELSINPDEPATGDQRPRRETASSQLVIEGLQSQLTKSGGAVSLDTQAGLWRHATIVLPAATTALNNAVLEEPKQEAEISFSGLQMLLIEDDELTRLLTARNLERRGARVYQVEDSAGAVAALDSQAFDLVIADLNLPDLSGAPMIAKLRASNNTVPIIVATVANGAADLQELIEAGADQLLGKPLQNEHVQLSVALMRAAGRAPAQEDGNRAAVTNYDSGN